MSQNETTIVQDSSAPLSSFQEPSDRENNSGPKVLQKTTENHSPRATPSRKGSSTKGDSSSLCVKLDQDRSLSGKEAEDEATDPHSLLEPSAIDFLGIGSQFKE